MAALRDPKTIITADAFTVAPHLLGTPLASPTRRAAAMLVDLAVVAIMIKAIGFTVFALAAGLLLFRIARPSGKGGKLRRGAALGVRFAAVIMLAAFAVSLADNVLDVVRRPFAAITVATGNGESDNRSDGDNPQFEFTDARALQLVALLESSGDDASARVHADSLAAWIYNRSADPEERARLTRWVLERSDSLDRGSLLTAALHMLADDSVQASDAGTIRAYADAIEQGDTASVERLRPQAQTAVAGARIQRLEQSLAESERSLRRANNQLENEKGGGIIPFVRSLADDLGVGFGWMAVYFTAFVVWWNGQTPGKRLFGMRIIRLDAKPISWWYAFERFGGYAASLSTGLLGFAQILWDRNRQGIHDKITSTVVIREGAPPAAAPPHAGHSAPPPRW